MDSHQRFAKALHDNHFASELFADDSGAYQLFRYLVRNSDAKVTMTTLDSGSIQVYATLPR